MTGALRELASDLWPVLSALLVLSISVIASSHAILNKRDVRASISWVGLIWLAPVFGAVLYWLLGRNRIRRRAALLRHGAPVLELPRDRHLVERAELSSLVSPTSQLTDLALLVENATGHSLVGGNSVVPLVDGDQAYPAMLEAIARARRSIGLSTYIFERAGPGERFVAALAEAVARGVEVRVLIDDVGARYGGPRVAADLRRRSVRTAHFLPARRGVAYFNLRNHRKLLLVDGETAFTGGMNIRPGHVLGEPSRHPVRDLHFQLHGPVVAQLVKVFAEDWCFTTHETLEGELWFPALRARGPIVGRVIPDGPDEDFDKLRWAFLGAIACARSSIRIMTPYFLPDMSLATALDVAALRGVRVDILVPEHGNLLLVQWAMWGEFRTVLEQGCRVWLNRGVFDHSKLMVVDEQWSLFGTPNWDPRSLRLNFELGVECYDRALAMELARYFDERKAAGCEVTPHELSQRSLSLRLRDGVARLLTPYM